MLVEGQIRTAEAFAFDYVNTMSDPAREAADCGAAVQFFDHQPAALVEDQALLTDKCELSRLKIPDPLGGGRMHNGIKAISLFKEKVGRERIIEGWIEGPCAEAADLRGINALMLDFYDDPAFVRDLFGFAVEMELRCKRKWAGVDLIGVGTRRLPRRSAALRGVRLALRKGWWMECMPWGRGPFFAGTPVLPGTNGRSAASGPGFVTSDAGQNGTGSILLGNLNPVTVLRNGDVRAVSGDSECHRQAGSR